MSPALDEGGKLLPFQAPVRRQPEIVHVKIPPIIDNSGVEEVDLPEKASAHMPSGLMVGMRLPEAVAQAVAFPEGEKPEDMHVTLAYIGKLSELPPDAAERARQAAAAVAEKFRPLSGKLGGVGRFAASEHSDGKDVFYLSVDVPGLDQLRNELVQQLQRVDLAPRADHGFNPHVTLKYLEPSELNPIEAIEPLEISFDSLTVSAGPEQTTVPLSVTAQDTPSPEGKPTTKARNKVPPVYDEGYFSGQLEPDLGFVRELGEVSRHLAGPRILEVGCGAGRALKVLNVSGQEADGIDSSPWAVEHCRKAGLPVMRYDATELPFSDGAYDTVFSMHCLEHIEGIAKAITESVRVARSKAVHLVPLGRRADPTHAHRFQSLDDFKEAVLSIKSLEGLAKSFHRIIDSPSGRGGDVAMFVVDKDIRAPFPVLEHIQPFTIIPDFVSLVGGAVKSGKPNDIDLLVRHEIPGMELRIRNLLPKGSPLRDKLHFVYNPPGPHDDSIPLYDLVAVPKRSFEVQKVEKVTLKPGDRVRVRPGLEHDEEHVGAGATVVEVGPPSIAIRFDGEDEIHRWYIAGELELVEKREHPAGYVAESEKIRHNRETVGKGPHKFKAAEWTHPNGHPRCILCGDEERTDGQCDGYENRQKATIKPLRRFAPPKTGKGYTQQEFFAPEVAWEQWAAGFIGEGMSIDVEKKYNGFRTILQIDGSGDTLIYFEDSKDDRSQQFPSLVGELKTIKSTGGVILDSDLGATYQDGRTVPRKFLGTLISKAQKVPEDGMFKLPTGDKVLLSVHVFDVVFHDGTDLHEQPWTERRKALERVFGGVDFRFLKMAEKHITNSKAEFIATIKKVSAEDGSEGAVAKAVNSDYPLGGENFGWMKLKNAVEIKVKVLSRTPVKGTTNQWNYIVAYRDAKGELRNLGKTFNTKVDAKPGDTLTLEVEEVIPAFGPIGWTVTAVVPKVNDIEPGNVPAEAVESIIRRADAANILQATPAERADLKRANILKSLASEIIAKQAEGNMDFKEGESGTGVIQTHERGLSEAQVKLTGSFGWEPVSLTDLQLKRLSGIVDRDLKPAYRAAQEGDSSGLSKALDSLHEPERFKTFSKADQELIALATPVSVHTDMRLQRGKDPYWEGGEGFTPGNQFKNNKIRDIQEGTEPGKVLMNFKTARVGESAGKGNIIRGPIVWLQIGRGTPKVFPPGAVGSTVNAWSRFHVRETFEWIAGIQDEHFKEFWIEGKPLSGRWLIQFAPVGPGAAQAEGRAWMLSRPAEQEPKSESLRETLAKGIDVAKAIWCPILKVDADRRLVSGIVLQPEVVDAQGDIISPEVIEQAAHDFLAEYNRRTQLGLQHRMFDVPLQLVESYVTPVAFSLGGKKVKQGTWIMTVKVWHDATWAKVKEGNIRGFSIGGVAKVKRLTF